MNARHIGDIAVTPSVFLYKLSSHTHLHHCRSPIQLVAWGGGVVAHPPDPNPPPPQTLTVSGQKSVDGG